MRRQQKADWWVVNALALTVSFFLYFFLSISFLFSSKTSMLNLLSLSVLIYPVISILHLQQQNGGLIFNQMMKLILIALFNGLFHNEGSIVKYT